MPFKYLKTPWSKAGNYGYFIMYSVYFTKHVITFSIEIVFNVISLTLFKKHFSARASLVGARKSTNSNLVNLTKEHALTRDSIALSKSKSEDAEKNVSMMVFVNSVMSFLHHIILITYTIYYLNTPKPNLTMRILQFCAFYMSVIRHASNFFIYYKFNINFKKECHILLEKLGIFKSLDNINNETGIGRQIITTSNKRDTNAGV